MKKLYVLFLFIIGIINQSYSKDFWERVNIPNDNIVNDISFSPNGDILTCNSGLFKSTDSGKSWSDISFFNFNGVKIQISATASWFQSIYPINDTIFFACMGDGPAFRSIDGGVSLEVMESISQNMHTFIKANNGRIFANASYDLFYSDDLGISWNRFEPWEISNVGTFSKVRMALTPEGKLIASNKGVWIIDPQTLESNHYVQGLDSSFIRCFTSSNGKIFAGTDSNGIYISPDNGVSWKNLINSPRSVSITVLTVSESGKLLAGSEEGGLFYSVDEGNSWQILNPSFAESKIFDIEVKGNIIYLCTNGIYTSNDDGVSWQGIPKNPGYPFAAWFDDNQSSDTYILTNNFFYKSDDNFNSWNKIDADLKLNELTDLMLSDKDKIFAILIDGSFKFSDDGGKTFKLVSSEFNNVKVVNIEKNSLGDLLIHVVNNIFSQIYISKNNGTSWNLLKDIGLNYFSGIGRDDEIIVYDFENSSVVFSKDYGKTWISKACKLIESSSAMIQKIEMKGDNIYIRTYTKGIIKSSDGGNTWAYINSGLNSSLKFGNTIRINDISIIGSKVYAVADFGLFSSNISDTTWTLEESGIIPSASRTVKFLKDKHIYTSTVLGMYRSIDEITSIESEPLDLNGIKIDVYPNPVNSNAVISINSNNAAILKLCLYDISGNIIKIIYDNSISTGITNLSFDAINIPSGQYYLRAESEKLSKSKIISIIR